MERGVCRGRRVTASARSSHNPCAPAGYPKRGPPAVAAVRCEVRECSRALGITGGGRLHLAVAAAGGGGGLMMRMRKWQKPRRAAALGDSPLGGTPPLRCGLHRPAGRTRPSAGHSPPGCSPRSHAPGAPWQHSCRCTDRGRGRRPDHIAIHQPVPRGAQRGLLIKTTMHACFQRRFTVRDLTGADQSAQAGAAVWQ